MKYEIGFYAPMSGCNKIYKCPIRSTSLFKGIFTYLLLPFYPCCRGGFYKRYIEKVKEC